MISHLVHHSYARWKTSNVNNWWLQRSGEQFRKHWQHLLRFERHISFSTSFTVQQPILVHVETKTQVPSIGALKYLHELNNLGTCIPRNTNHCNMMSRPLATWWLAKSTIVMANVLARFRGFHAISMGFWGIRRLNESHGNKCIEIWIWNLPEV